MKTFREYLIEEEYLSEGPVFDWIRRGIKILFMAGLIIACLYGHNTYNKHYMKQLAKKSPVFLEKVADMPSTQQEIFFKIFKDKYNEQKKVKGFNKKMAADNIDWISNLVHSTLITMESKKFDLENAGITSGMASVEGVMRMVKKLNSNVESMTKDLKAMGLTDDEINAFIDAIKETTKKHINEIK